MRDDDELDGTEHTADFLDDDELDLECSCEDGCERSSTVDGVSRCDECGGLV